MNTKTVWAVVGLRESFPVALGVFDSPEASNRFITLCLKSDEKRPIFRSSMQLYERDMRQWLDNHPLPSHLAGEVVGYNTQSVEMHL